MRARPPTPTPTPTPTFPPSDSLDEVFESEAEVCVALEVADVREEVEAEVDEGLVDVVGLADVVVVWFA